MFIQNIINMKNLFFIREERALLDDISIDIRAEKTTVILGIAGSGKTTFLKAAAGLLIPDSGTLSLYGKDFDTYSKKEVKRIRKTNGFVFQDAALWENMTIEQNLKLPIQFHYPNIPDEDISERINTWIKRTGFWDTITGRPAAYSHGERKKISIIRALITEPSLIFMDNPTELIDHAGGQKIIKILKELKEKKTTMIIVSQEPNILRDLADDIIVLDKGKIIEYGPKKNIFSSGNHPTKRVISHIRDAEGIDTGVFNEIKESAAGKKEIFDSSDINDTESKIGPDNEI